MKKAFQMLILTTVVGGLIVKFMPEIQAFYDDTLGGCVEETKRVAKLQEERIEDMDTLLQNIK